MKSIFLMGDSILIGYKTKLYEFLHEKFIIQTKAGELEALKDLDFPRGMNTGDSRQALAYMKEQEQLKRINYDYCIFNCGAHDIKREAKTKMLQVGLEEYEKNLSEIIDLLHKNNTTPIFVTTVPIYDEVHNSLVGLVYTRSNEDLIKYNDVAKRVMDQYHVPVIDLCYFTGVFGKNALRDHIHLKPEICDFQAAFIAGAVLSIID